MTAGPLSEHMVSALRVLLLAATVFIAFELILLNGYQSEVGGLLRRGGERGRALASINGGGGLHAKLEAVEAERQRLAQHVSELEDLLSDMRTRNDRLEEALHHSHSSLQDQLHSMASWQGSDDKQRGANFDGELDENWPYFADDIVLPDPMEFFPAVDALADSSAGGEAPSSDSLVLAARSADNTRAIPKVADVDIFPSGNEEGNCVGRDAPTKGVVAAVVTVAFNRASYLKRHIESVLAARDQQPAHKRGFPLFISQDGTPPDEETRAAAVNFSGRGVKYLHHMEWEQPVTLSRKENMAYYRIANHYKFVLHTIFDCFAYPKLIILEEDMDLAPDFFSYFAATAPLLEADRSLMCVSSWNDHGQAQFVKNATRLYRSDFFPGLGWMLHRQLWDELKSEWAKSYWDDWMRLQKVRQGRQCIRPEVSRTYNFGMHGASKGLFFKRFLQPVKLNEENIDWSKQNLSYLDPARYEQDFNATYNAAPIVADVQTAVKSTGPVRLLYQDQHHYERLTGRLGMMKEWKDGIPRAAYHMVVTVQRDNASIMIGPAPEFKPEEPAESMATDSTGARVPRWGSKRGAGARRLGSGADSGGAREAAGRTTDWTTTLREADPSRRRWSWSKTDEFS